MDWHAVDAGDAKLGSPNPIFAGTLRRFDILREVSRRVVRPLGFIVRGPFSKLTNASKGSEVQPRSKKINIRTLAGTPNNHRMP